MNKIVMICIGFTIALITFFIIYLTPYFSKKKIRKGKFDLLQFVTLFFSPIVIIPLMYFLRKIINTNPSNFIIIFPEATNELLFLFLVYFFILGLGIHSVSVILSKHMKDLKKHKIWEINEFFHNKFSHFLITASAVLILLGYSIMEINHPNVISITRIETIIILISSTLCGIILGIGSIEGSIPKFMIAINYILSMVIPFMFIRYKLDYRFFPFSTFIEIMYIVSVATILLYKKFRKGFPEIVPQYFFD